jgi:hypothetical protein
VHRYLAGGYVFAGLDLFVAIRKGEPMKQYRQGDVYFKEVKSIPAGGKVRKSGHILEGEVTGHIHRIAELEAAEVLDCGEQMFLSVTAEGGVSIVHEDHKTLDLPTGNYEVVRQREYSPEAIRNVCD